MLLAYEGPPLDTNLASCPLGQPGLARESQLEFTRFQLLTSSPAPNTGSSEEAWLPNLRWTKKVSDLQEKKVTEHRAPAPRSRLCLRHEIGLL